MGQELGYIKKDDTLTLTTDDESFPVADIQYLVDECLGTRSLQIQDIPKDLLQINQLKKLTGVSNIKLTRSRIPASTKEIAKLFPQLETLSISGCSNIDYSCLSSLKNLKCLRVNGSGFAGKLI